MQHQLVKQATKNCNKINKPFILNEFAIMRRLILLSIIALPVFAADGQPATYDAAPEKPETPMPVQSGETLEPDITIIRRGKKTIQEFRQGGRLYMVKVVPDIGPPYYFLDTNGDGKLDVRSSDPDSGSRINMWKLLEWK